MARGFGASESKYFNPYGPAKWAKGESPEEEEEKMINMLKKMTDNELGARRKELFAILYPPEQTWRMREAREQTAAGKRALYEFNRIREIQEQRKQKREANEMEKKHAKEATLYKKAAEYLAMTGKTLPKEFNAKAFGVPTDSNGWVSLDNAAQTNEGKALLSKTPIGQIREAEKELVKRAPGNIFNDYEDDRFEGRKIQNVLVEEINGEQGAFQVKVVSNWIVSHGYDNSYTEIDRQTFVRKIED